MPPMSQQQRIARLMDWILTRPDDESQMLQDGINAIVDLAEEVFRELRVASNDPSSPPTVAVQENTRPMSNISMLMLPPPAHQAPAVVTILPTPSVMSTLRLPSALSMHEANAHPEFEVESDGEDIDFHRYLTLQRLEGRIIAHEPNEEVDEYRVRMWVMAQGLEHMGEVQERASPELVRPVALVAKPLRRTRGFIDLRAAVDGDVAVEVSARVLHSNTETTGSPGGHFPLSPEARFESLRSQTTVSRRPWPPQSEASVAPVESASQIYVTGTTTPKPPRIKKREKVRRFFRRMVSIERDRSED